MRNCVACGAPLQPNMTFCPNCGRFTSTPNQTATNADDRTVAAASSPQQEMFNAPRFVDMSGSPRISYDHAQAYPQQASQAYQQQAPQTYSSQPFYTTPTTPPVPAQQGNKRLPKGTVILLTVMALLIMAGGIALSYYTAIAQPAQFHARATATVQAIENANAQATMTAQAQATATAQAQAHATATAQAQATATAYQNIYKTATSGTPTLTSSLAFQDGASWDIDSAVGGGGCGFAGGAYHSSTFAQHTYFPCFAQASNFSNFAFQVQMTILKGEGGGLIFRADDVNTKFYFLTISQDGTFSLLVTSDAKTNTPLIDDTNPAVKTGHKSNLVTIIARGSKIYLYVNKQYVGSTNDSTYSSGKIGVFADDTDAATDVAFNNANVWTL